MKDNFLEFLKKRNKNTREIFTATLMIKSHDYKLGGSY